MTCLTCPSCQADLLTCSCRAIDERIRLALRSPEGKSLPIPYYNALVRRASGIIEARIRSKTCDACCRLAIPAEQFLISSLPAVLRG